jgi:hypothetical protein
VAAEALDDILLVQGRGGIQEEEPALGQSPEMVLDYQRPEIDPVELQTSSYRAADDTRQDYSWGIKQCCGAEKFSFGSDSGSKAEPSIFISAPIPAPITFYKIQCLDNYLF